MGCRFLKFSNPKVKLDFREREYQALRGVLTPDEKVISLGGGALTIPHTRELAEANGRVVMLNASPETLLTRLQGDSVERPLLTGDAENNLRALLARRGEHYAYFAMQIDTDGKSPSEIAWEIQVSAGDVPGQRDGEPQASGLRCARTSWRDRCSR